MLVFNSVLVGAGVDVGRVYQLGASYVVSPRVSLNWFVNEDTPVDPEVELAVVVEGRSHVGLDAHP